MENKKVLITGAAGSIGSELYRQLAPNNTVYAVDNNETSLFDLHEGHVQKGYKVHYRLGDVRDMDLFNGNDFVPDVIFHCAALKHVTPSEKYPEEVIRTNVLGTLNVVRMAKRLKVKKLVYVSTDKAANATCVMGVTKRLGELVVRNAGYTAVRFGNVMHSRGSVLEIWSRQIQAGEPITITDPDAERYMMSIPDACRLLVRAAVYGKGGEILIMDMGKRVRIGDLAEKFAPSHPVRIIGLRPGEAMTEELMTPQEAKTAKKEGDFYYL